MNQPTRQIDTFAQALIIQRNTLADEVAHWRAVAADALAEVEKLKEANKTKTERTKKP